jgi:hypothetical protein
MKIDFKDKKIVIPIIIFVGVLALVLSSLNICGGNMLSDWYWTSTQDGSGSDNSKLNAVAISQSEGNATVSYKLNAFPVRPVIAIK